MRTYGAKLMENATQACARDISEVEAALRIDRLRLGELVLSVHDELLFEVPITGSGIARARGDRAADQLAAGLGNLDLPIAS